MFIKSSLLIAIIRVKESIGALKVLADRVSEALEDVILIVISVIKRDIFIVLILIK